MLVAFGCPGHAPTAPYAHPPAFRVLQLMPNMRMRGHLPCSNVIIVMLSNYGLPSAQQVPAKP